MKIGSLVFLSKKGRDIYINSHRRNPFNQIGKLIESGVDEVDGLDPWIFKVEWQNKVTNMYRKGELVEIKDFNEIIGGIKPGEVDPDFLESLEDDL